MRLSKELCSIYIDALHSNALKAKIDQKSMRELSQQCGCSIITLTKVRDILIEMKLLVKEGTLRNQKIYWNLGKAHPNADMAREVYRRYISDGGPDVKVKVRQRKSPSTSLETALKTLVKLGFTGEIHRAKLNGFTRTVEYIDLSKIEE